MKQDKSFSHGNKSHFNGRNRKKMKCAIYKCASPCGSVQNHPVTFKTNVKY